MVRLEGFWLGFWLQKLEQLKGSRTEAAGVWLEQPNSIKFLAVETIFLAVMTKSMVVTIRNLVGRTKKEKILVV